MKIEIVLHVAIIKNRIINIWFFNRNVFSQKENNCLDAFER